MTTRLLFVLPLAVFPGFAVRAADNVLTQEEKNAGWELLFDGASFDGWRGYRLAGPPADGWEIRDGTLRTVAGVNGVPLITTKTFDDFELAWEWRTGRCHSRVFLEGRPPAFAINLRWRDGLRAVRQATAGRLRRPRPAQRRALQNDTALVAHQRIRQQLTVLLARL